MYKKPKKEFPIKYIREGLSEDMHESEIDSTKKVIQFSTKLNRYE